MAIKMIQVESSNIAAVGYDPETQVLDIEFNTGDRYSYDDVPKSTYDELMRASSVGRYFAANIKGRYRFYRS